MAAKELKPVMTRKHQGIYSYGCRKHSFYYKFLFFFCFSLILLNKMLNLQSELRIIAKIHNALLLTKQIFQQLLILKSIL